MPDNPFVSNLPVSSPPHHSSYLATARGLPFSLLHSVDGSLDNSLQGKVAELRQELNGGGREDRNHSAKKITLKKIVANMTMSNNDMVGVVPRHCKLHADTQLGDQENVRPHCICSNSLGRY